MDTALPRMLHCFTANGSSTDMAVLQRHMARRKWQEDQLKESDRNLNSYGGFSLNEFRGLFSSPIQVSKVQSFQGLMGGNESALAEVVVGSLKPDPGFDVVWPELEMPSMESGSSGLVKGTAELEANYSVSRASSSTPAIATPAPGEAKLQESMEKMNSATDGRDSLKRRSVEKTQNTVVRDSKEKKVKVSIEETESKMADQNSTKTDNHKETSADTAKENNSKASDFQKPDYIHVRARRGQATDSHSLAERVRREKISEKMRYLQDLVPGCNKITGKAGMLDEIINYVQSLQCQVEFLSMKLATLNPRLEPIVDGIFAKEVFPSCTSNFPNVGISSEANNSAYALQFNPLQQMLSTSGLEMERSPTDIGLRRTISTPVSFIPETFVSSSCFTQNQPPSAFEADLQKFYNVSFDKGRSTDFSSHSYTGSIEASSLKMEIGFRQLMKEEFNHLDLNFFFESNMCN